MAQKTKQWAAIVMMVALFAMIAFVTNLCSPMAVIVQNQFGASEFQSQIGNYANFIAYLVMGIPSGMLIVKFGYKKTALLALIVGIIGMVLELLSGTLESMWIYLLGAFIAAWCTCLRFLCMYAQHRSKSFAQCPWRRRQHGKPVDSDRRCFQQRSSCGCLHYPRSFDW